MSTDPAASSEPTSGVMLERDDGIRIVRLISTTDALAYRAGFAGVYQTVFAEPPYNERFYPSEAQAVLRSHLENQDSIVLLAVKGISQVVGFGLAIPVMSRADVTRELRGLLPVRRSMYLSELGVLPRYRGSGLGRMLVELRLNLIDLQRFDHVTLRTSASRDGAYNMFMQLGFEDMGVYMEVRSRRTEGSVSTDRRLFLCKHFEGGSAEPEEQAHSYDEDTTDPETWLPQM